MATSFGSLDTLGQALDNIGFRGASYLNPKNMQNNCVSVSVAQMLGMDTLEDLWQETYGYPLADRPLDFAEVTDLLQRSKFDFLHATFDSVPGGKTAYQLLVAQKTSLFTTIEKYIQNKPVNPYSPRARGGAVNMIVLYTRKNGSGPLIFIDFGIPSPSVSPI